MNKYTIFLDYFLRKCAWCMTADAWLVGMALLGGYLLAHP